MAKKGKGKKAKPLTGLAAALVKSGHLSEKKARDLTRGQRRENKALGREGVAKREEEKQAGARDRREAEAEESREREQKRQGEEATSRARRVIADNLCPCAGGRRWFFVTRSGRIEFLEVDGPTGDLLLDGRAGIVESLGASVQSHAVVSERALTTLHPIDPEWIRFWNKPNRLEERRMVVEETVEIGGRRVTFETGAIARQASGAVVVSAGETTLLAAATADTKPTRLPYMPLTTEYRQRLASAGRIPGSYDRREGRPTAPEILTSRLVDRSIRPFFPATWCYDTQVIISPLSYDPATDVPVLAISAAAAVLNVSTIPWEVAMGGVRIACCDGELIAFPTAEQRVESDLDLLISGSRGNGIVMLEGGAREVSERLMLEAFDLAQRSLAPLHDLVDRLRERAGREKRSAEPPPDDPELRRQVTAAIEAPLREALAIAGKQDRYAAVDAVTQTVLDDVADLDPERQELARAMIEAVKKKLIREGILAGRRLGGRGSAEIRPISGRAGWLKRCHGSGLFTRGETQAITTCTLGTERSAQRIETIDGEIRQRFLLHYNFPPYCVGEARPLRGPGRREIGHGHLARRALMPLFPQAEEWPYTTRVEATITESNGSSSMATVCAGTLALMDAGVPLLRPVAGIAMGLVKEDESHVVLSDILGDEDHVGDMDFKVAGTREGITAIQLDNKLGSVPLEVMERALEQAREGRLHILGKMEEILPAPRESLNPHASRVAVVPIAPNRIRDLIGRGGATIKAVRAETGVEIEIEEDGLVKLFGPSDESIERAKVRVEDLTGLPEVGREYDARVVSVKHFGAFVRIFEGIEGLLRGDDLLTGKTVRIRVTGVSREGKLEIQRVT